MAQGDEAIGVSPDGATVSVGGREYNPTGCYRREVHVAWSADEGPICLHLGAVTSAVYVWVNGSRVGYSQDSKLPAEFDVTEHVRAAAGGKRRRPLASRPVATRAARRRPRRATGLRRARAR